MTTTVSISYQSRNARFAPGALYLFDAVDRILREEINRPTQAA